jgi:hypothetical protein
MLGALLLLLGGAEASACDAVPAAPKIPMPTEFSCPVGATASASDGSAKNTGIECISRDGKPTGDTFNLDGKSGLMVHPLGLSLAWADGVVSWWQQRPSGHRVTYEAGRPSKVEHYVGGDLQCAKHFDGARLVRSFEGGKWSWLDKKGRAIDPKTPLEKSEIASVMKEHTPEVQLCYESRLHEVKGEFHGTLALTVEIENGDAKSVKISEDTLRDPPVADCVAARVAAWKFRPSTEAVEVTFPFVFKERR